MGNLTDYLANVCEKYDETDILHACQVVSENNRIDNVKKAYLLATGKTKYGQTYRIFEEQFPDYSVGYLRQLRSAAMRVDYHLVKETTRMTHIMQAAKLPPEEQAEALEKLAMGVQLPPVDPTLLEKRTFDELLDSIRTKVQQALKLAPDGWRPILEMMISTLDGLQEPLQATQTPEMR